MSVIIDMKGGEGGRGTTITQTQAQNEPLLLEPDTVWLGSTAELGGLLLAT